MKFCINCQHYIPPHEAFKDWYNARSYSKCRRAISHTSPVDGAVTYRYCDLEREDGFPDRCGPDAKNWEAKP